MRAAACCLLAALAAADAAAQPPQAPLVFTLAIAAGKVPADRRVLRVAQGAQVEIRISSDAPGEVHLHGYRFAAKVAPGMEARWSLHARATGRFRIEWHPKGEGDSHAHGPPLASLEVLPP